MGRKGQIGKGFSKMKRWYNQNRIIRRGCLWKDQQNNVPGGRNSKSRSPKVSMTRAWWRKRRKTSVAGGEWAERTKIWDRGGKVGWGQITPDTMVICLGITLSITGSLWRTLSQRVMWFFFFLRGGGTCLKYNFGSFVGSRWASSEVVSVAQKDDGGLH